MFLFAGRGLARRHRFSWSSIRETQTRRPITPAPTTQGIGVVTSCRRRSRCSRVWWNRCLASESHRASIVGAVLIVANWGYTMLAMPGLNNRIMQTSEEAADATWNQILRRLGRLHAVRGALGLAATTAFLCATSHIR